MPNNYFQFKQFTVYQDKCAMKVCTDACLFGSLSATLFPSPIKILDIGTGTGLLALMQAQKHPSAVIDAVEIDPAAAQQAADNFAASAWQQRLRVFNTSIQAFNPETAYDLIICNPPFFENDLKSDDPKRNVALHSQSLNLAELVIAAERLLNHSGILGVLLPYHRTTYFESRAVGRGFYLSQKILVKQTPAHNYFRAVLFFTKMKTAMAQKEIIIQDEERRYTTAFRELLKDYYLYL